MGKIERLLDEILTPEEMVKSKLGVEIDKKNQIVRITFGGEVLLRCTPYCGNHHESMSTTVTKLLKEIGMEVESTEVPTTAQEEKVIVKESMDNPIGVDIESHGGITVTVPVGDLHIDNANIITDTGLGIVQGKSKEGKVSQKKKALIKSRKKKKPHEIKKEKNK